MSNFIVKSIFEAESLTMMLLMTRRGHDVYGLIDLKSYLRISI